MKKQFLLLALVLVSPLGYSADDVEESPPAIGIGCAGCGNNQSIADELYRAEMDRAAAAAEAQRGLAAQREAEAQAAAQRIEQEAKAKWCSDTLANIPIAISRCKSDARSTYSRNLYYICKGETSRTIEGNITVYIFGGTVSSTTSCSGTYEAERDATISRCETDGLIVERTVKAQCKG